MSRASDGPFDNHVLYQSLSVFSPHIPPPWKKRLMNVVDSFFALFVISPLVIGHWRGTWEFMNLFPRHFPGVNCMIFGAIIHCCLAILREPLHTRYNASQRLQTKSRTKSFNLYIVKKIYTYVFSIGCIMHWRGGWAVMEQYLGDDLWPAVIVSVVCFIPLVLMRAVRNLVAPPIVIITDSKEFAFNFPTRYRIDGTRDPGLYILDCLFSVLVIGSLVVFVWRGLWVFLDLKLFPEDPKQSAWASLIIGYAIVGITFSMQPVMRWACEKLDGFRRIIVADIFLFLSFVGTVNVWRGIWQLLDQYFLPNNLLLSDWLTHGVSLILLILLNCSNSVLVRGVYIDAEEPAGQCVIFPVYYIRLFFQKERTKKQKRLMEKLEKIDQNNTVLLIEKPQLNHHAANETQIKHTTLSISNEDVKANEFSESDKNNEEINENGEKKVLCDNE